MRQLPDGPLLVLDGAHNAMAAEALAGPVDGMRRTANMPLFLVVGMVGGHDPAGVLGAFAEDAERIFVCQPTWKRAIPAEEVAEAARKLKCDRAVTVIPPVAEAVRAAVEAAGPGAMVLVTGSFYTVGEVPEELR
jgi:dihydrofolate synthase/folylpolyglutamate synthase